MANYTPEELAQIAQFNREGGGINPYMRSSATRPQVAQFQLGEYARDLRDKVTGKYNDVLAKAPGAYEGAVKNARNAGLTSRNVGGTTAVAGGLLTAAQQFGQDQPVGAIASIPGSILGSMGMGALANNLTKAMPGPVGTIVRAVAPLVGGIGFGNIFAATAEGAKNLFTGEQIGKKPETARTDAPKYAGNIPLNESARMLDLARAMGEQELSLSNKQNASDIGFSQQINQYAIQNQIQLMKAQMPYLEQLKNKDLVRSQALLNTQGNIDARLGLLATQGALAKGGQAEMGAFARTAISTNPYANAATRQSPNIQFG